ncbi:copper chaperone PCu(A)C [Pararhodobacter sp.]|uniref:copper chaperone PCu(A)C n=1 Tax=Pararhodobacter sp. TaxID=2127056 RepID=UPI002FDCE369
MFRTFTAASVAALFALPALACDGFEVHEAYARTSTAMSQTGAAFMVIQNHGDTDCHITGVRSDIAARTELHTHSEDAQGVMRMIHVEEGFALPADSELVLERGGNHVMFMGLNQTLAQGDVVEVTFIFADDTEATVDVTVDLERQPGAHGHSHGHSHSN